jgi:hypothetical protein
LTRVTDDKDLRIQRALCVYLRYLKHKSGRSVRMLHVDGPYCMAKRYRATRTLVYGEYDIPRG